MDNAAETVNITESTARDPRAAWLPESMTMKIINMNEAIKNYCAAVSDKMYFDYCRVHARTEEYVGERRIIKWQNPDAVAKFDGPIKRYLKYLYGRYWRLLPMAQGYPKDAPLELGLTPPSVPNFKVMLAREERIKNGQ
jgi:hypothetical protein